jgi:hypothetical protein
MYVRKEIFYTMTLYTPPASPSSLKRIDISNSHIYHNSVAIINKRQRVEVTRDIKTQKSIPYNEPPVAIAANESCLQSK